MRWRDAADLAGNQLEPATVKRAAKGRRHIAVAIPAQFDHARLVSRQAERGRQARGGSAGMDDKIAIVRCGLGRREADA